MHAEHSCKHCQEKFPPISRTNIEEEHISILATVSKFFQQFQHYFTFKIGSHLNTAFRTIFTPFSNMKPILPTLTLIHSVFSKNKTRITLSLLFTVLHSQQIPKRHSKRSNSFHISEEGSTKYCACMFPKTCPLATKMNINATMVMPQRKSFQNFAISFLLASLFNNKTNPSDIIDMLITP